MKRLVMALFLFLCENAGAASGEIYLGGYLGPGPGSEPDNTSGAKMVAGLSLEEKVGWLHPFIDVETRIDKVSSDMFHPSSVEYGIGARAEFDPVTIEAVHRCWHHVDKKGDNQQYNLVVIKYGF